MEETQTKHTENTEERLFSDEINLGFGISECLQYLEKNKTILDDGIQSDEEDEIDIDRYDDLGKKIAPFEQYKIMCHRFHGNGKKPTKTKHSMKAKEIIKRNQMENGKNGKHMKLKANELLKMRIQLNNLNKGNNSNNSNNSNNGNNGNGNAMIDSTKKLLSEKKQPFIDLFFTSRKTDDK